MVAEIGDIGCPIHGSRGDRAAKTISTIRFDQQCTAPCSAHDTAMTLAVACEQPVATKMEHQQRGSNFHSLYASTREKGVTRDDVLARAGLILIT